jgi:hypothetical protein
MCFSGKNLKRVNLGQKTKKPSKSKRANETKREKIPKLTEKELRNS